MLNSTSLWCGFTIAKYHGIRTGRYNMHIQIARRLQKIERYTQVRISPELPNPYRLL